jgi:UDP-glucose 4-epimerase
VYGDGKQTRDFVYIDDLLQGLWLAAEHPQAVGRVFNLASGRAYTLLELLQAIEEAVGSPLEPQFTAPRPGDIRHSFADIRAARGILGYEPRISLQEGIRRTLNAYREAMN